MKIKEQTRKLAAGCSKHGFEVVDKVTLTWFEEIFEEYKGLKRFSKSIK
ncbi:chlorohydrolase [Streptococcus pneumoniae]|nr:chlorohydrolase [Streptococcus pneumoniae]